MAPPIDPRNPPAVAEAVNSENRIVLAPKRVYVMTTSMLEKRAQEFDAGDDVTKDYKTVMVKHTADTTTDARNDYPIAEQPLTDGSLRNPDGTPAAFTPPGLVSNNPQKDFSRAFEDSSVRKAYSTFEESSNPYLKIGTGLGKLPLKKGKTSNGAMRPIDDLYSELMSDPDGSVLRRVIETGYQENNIFSEKNPHTPPEGNIEEEQTNVGKMIVQRERGVHVPRKLGSDVEPESQATTSVDIRVLKQLGYQMLFGASGEYYEPGAVADVGDLGQDALNKVSSLAPGLARLGLRVPITRFSPTELMSKMDPEFTKPNLTTGLKGDVVQSYGNVNNPLIPFDSLDSRFALPAAVLLSTSLSVILQGIAEVLSADAFNSSGFIETLGISTSGGGNFRNSPTQPSLIYRTRNNFPSAVRRGFEVLAGSDADIVSNPAGFIGSSARTFNESPGYYSTLLRSVLRGVTFDILGNTINAIATPVGAIISQTGGSGTGTVRNALGTVGVPGDLDINPQSGLSADVSNVAVSIQRIFNSKTIRFINIAAMIGDLVLTNENNPRELKIFLTGDELGVDPLEPEHGRYLAALPKISKFGATSRLHHKTSTPYGTSTTPSLYILPEGILTGETRLGSSNKIDGTYGGRPDFKKITGGRILKEDVTALEKHLEASYVPFYFHDLRTNEIISFHAFLGSLTDNYEVDYSNAEGYGRIGALPIYKNTNRAISFDFNVVATNEADFEEMWWKINKLVTLTFPQYSEGRVLSSGGKRFTQPFSQIPTSSPVIRLRIGDVIKSNYDRFNLARTFGITKIDTNVFNLDNNSDISSRRNSEEESSRRTTRTRALADFTHLNVEDRITVDFRDISAEYTSGIRNGQTYSIRLVEAPDRDSGTTEVVMIRTLADGELKRLKIVGTEPTTAEDSDVVTYIAEILNVPEWDGGQIKIRITTSAPRDRHAIVPNYPTSDEVTEALSRESTSSAGGSSDVSSESSTEGGIDLQEFFSPENNAIVKSFESTRGRGLAGVIKSMNFTWIEDTITWNIGTFNGRAPKMAKVQISFTPIHDLAPGLDSDGFNTAPIYGVGKLSTATKKIVAGSEGEGENSSGENSFAESFARFNSPPLRNEEEG